MPRQLGRHRHIRIRVLTNRARLLEQLDQANRRRLRHDVDLGLVRKSEVDIVTESPSIRLIELFEEAGAVCEYSDPYVAVAPKLAGHDIGRRSSLTLTP